MTTILLKRSFTPGTVPVSSQLLPGEVAINISDGKMWSVDESNNLVLLGGLQDGSSLPTTDPAEVGALWNDNGTVRISNG